MMKFLHSYALYFTLKIVQKYMKKTCIGFSAFDISLITNDRGGTMNGAATVTASEDHQHQHQQAQNETTSEHPRSPASPLSVRHGELIR